MTDHTITFHSLDGVETTLKAKDGENLRRFLLNTLSAESAPYTKYTKI